MDIRGRQAFCARCNIWSEAELRNNEWLCEVCGHPIQDEEDKVSYHHNQDNQEVWVSEERRRVDSESEVEEDLFLTECELEAELSVFNAHERVRLLGENWSDEG